jgi:hypothetical protein
MMDCIKKGIDRSIGNSETRDLVLKTLNLFYNLNEDDIPSSLGLFESSIKNIFGDSISKIILSNIAKECTIY